MGGKVYSTAKHCTVVKIFRLQVWKIIMAAQFFSRRATFTYILSVRGQNPQSFFFGVTIRQSVASAA